jgi:hypothetical protein
MKELSKFRIRCIIELFFIKEGDEFYYDAETDEYFNDTQTISGRLAREWTDNFENVTFNENTDSNSALETT